MAAYPNEIYTAFSFIGFLMCAIPFYWHLEGTWRIRVIGLRILRTHVIIAWNTGTCMYMAWTGLGCLIQCINSIVWNGNMANRAPFYCDIGELLDALSRERSLTLRYPTVTHIQIGLNVAIPACSLCINRRLYKVATINAVMVTRSEKRRAIMIDLLIGVGIPILQMIVREFAYSFPSNRLFTQMQRRVHCFVSSLRHI